MLVCVRACSFGLQSGSWQICAVIAVIYCTYIISLAEITRAHRPTHTHPLNTRHPLLVPKSAGLFPHGASKRRRLRDQRVLRLCSSARLLSTLMQMCARQSGSEGRRAGRHACGVWVTIDSPAIHIRKTLLFLSILSILFIILPTSLQLCAPFVFLSGAFFNERHQWRNPLTGLPYRSFTHSLFFLPQRENEWSETLASLLAVAGCLFVYTPKFIWQRSNELCLCLNSTKRPAVPVHYDVTQMNQPTELLSAVQLSRHGINPLLTKLI